MSVKNSWLCRQYIAHRGLHNDRLPENSMGAFLNASEHGFAIELDVHLTGDGKVAVFHDYTLGRMTGLDGHISGIESNKLFDCKLNKSEYGIPLLSEVLEAVSGKVPILIELKNSAKTCSLEKAVLSCLKDYKGEYAVQAFNPYSLEFFKLNANHIPRGQLSCFFRGEDLAWYKKFALKRMLFNKKVSCPDFVAYAYTDIPNRFVRRYSNLPLVVWTVRTPEAFADIKPLCDNIIFEGFIPEFST